MVYVLVQNNFHILIAGKNICHLQVIKKSHLHDVLIIMYKKMYIISLHFPHFAQ